MARGLKKIKIFIGSSKELKYERDEFRKFISGLNDRFIDKKIYFEIIQWENFLDCISDTRLQDEYNKALLKADIALFLFFTKVGTFSEEEFKTAYTKFKETGKPCIWTYFKDAPISTGTITPEINTLLAFRKKLNALGHFISEYSSTPDLHNKFRNQLDLFLPILLTPAELKHESKHEYIPNPVVQTTPVPGTTNLLNKEEILILLDIDIDKAFEKLDPIFLNKNGTYNDLSREYFQPPNNFALANFRNKLRRFISLNWK